jgi:regulator of sirC expression with transglutaminase-like and TPR domain
MVAALEEMGESIRLSDVRALESLHYPLTAIAVPGDELALTLIYHSDRIEADAAEHVAFDIPVALERLAQLAEGARPGLNAISTRPVCERVDQLNQHLFRDEGFRGCEQSDYYEPRQSFLNEVLESRTGLPISLSIVYVDVARRLGLRSFGIAFPGHFLVRVEPDASSPEGAALAADLAADPDRDADSSQLPIVVDPFKGHVVSRDECAERLTQALGPQARFDSSWLRAASPREILVRVLGNLKGCYADLENWEAALACADRSLLLVPDAPLELRDRGILYQHLECYGAAADDLERFLELAPDHESAAAIRKSLSALRSGRSTLH